MRADHPDLFQRNLRHTSRESRYISVFTPLRCVCEFSGAALASPASSEESPMSQPLIVSIPHSLGRQEAKRRLDSGISRLRPELAGLVSSLDYSWEEDRLNFRATALWQTITGAIDVLDDAVRIEIDLPW